MLSVARGVGVESCGSSSFTKKDWTLSPQAFAKLLAALDSDPGRAGEAYEAVRRRLIKLFQWRGSESPEDCADETINRVARKIDEGEIIHNISSYFGGVARLVLLERVKERERERAALELQPPPTSLQPAQTAEEPQADARLECFESCMRALPAEMRELILEYYNTDDDTSRIDGRRRMATKLGLEPNALRNRALRVRTKLEACIGECMKKSEQPRA